MAAFNKINGVFKKISFGLAYVSMVVTFAVMIMMIIAIVLRFFKSGIPGSIEITEVAMVVIVFLGLAYTQYIGGHVHVDIFTNMIKNIRARFVFNGIIRIVTAFFSFWVTYAAFLRAPEERAATGVLRLPLSPFVYVMAIGMLIFTIVLLLDGIDHILQGTSKEGPRQQKSEAEEIVEEAQSALED